MLPAFSTPASKFVAEFATALLVMQKVWRHAWQGVGTAPASTWACVLLAAVWTGQYAPLVTLARLGSAGVVCASTPAHALLYYISVAPVPAPAPLATAVRALGFQRWPALLAFTVTRYPSV